MTKSKHILLQMLLIGAILFLLYLMVKPSFISSAEYPTYETEIRMRRLGQAMEIFNQRFGYWPKTLDDLTNIPRNIIIDGAHPANFVDSWTNRILLVPFDENLGSGQIISRGPDGVNSTTDDLRRIFPQ